MAKRINIHAAYDLLLEAAGHPRPRFISASSIAVFGDPLPPLVDDTTPISLKMIYGGHKAMMELAVALGQNPQALLTILYRSTDSAVVRALPWRTWPIVHPSLLAE